jgi:hypothetical protein
MREERAMRSIQRLAAALFLVWIAAACGRFKGSPADPGVPIYPGAQNANEDTFSSRLKPQVRARLVKALIYETDDPTTKVIEFYKKNLKSSSQVFEKTARGVPAAVIRTEVSGKAKLLMITADEDRGKTQILIGDIQDKQP